VPANVDAASALEGTGSSPLAVSMFDDIFVAVHADAAPALLPYETDRDRKCSWVSQWIFKLTACALFRNHTLMFPALRVHNPEHSLYPRQDCFLAFGNASQRLRDLAPSSAGDCLPDPLARGYLFAHGKLGPTAYLPWGTAKRKSGDAGAVDYTRASVSSVSSCAAELDLVRRHSHSRTHRYCPGCEPSAVLYLLQTSASKSPLWAPTWLELGLLTWGALGDIPVASVCIAVARRLRSLRGQPPVPEMDEAAMALDQELGRRGYAPTAYKSDWLWEVGVGRRNLEGFLRVALTSAHARDQKSPLLISEAVLQWFLDILLGDLDMLGQRPQGRDLGDWATFQ